MDHAFPGGPCHVRLLPFPLLVVARYFDGRFAVTMAKKKGAAGKGAAKQEAKELKKKKQEEKASKAAKKKSGKVCVSPVSRCRDLLQVNMCGQRERTAVEYV